AAAFAHPPDLRRSRPRTRSPGRSTFLSARTNVAHCNQLTRPERTPRLAGMSARADVIIREVGLRDGLQSIARVLPTEQKLEWIRDAWAAGQREMEVGSF